METMRTKTTKSAVKSTQIQAGNFYATSQPLLSIVKVLHLSVKWNYKREQYQ